MTAPSLCMGQLANVSAFIKHNLVKESGCTGSLVCLKTPWKIRTNNLRSTAERFLNVFIYFCYFSVI